jgi:predicted anti-sigma-YlaC factor YlaD
MHEEMRALLNAYLDGEMRGRRLREMETHLASCAACQKELSELRLVSDILQAVPTPEVISSERFVSQLTLRLPRRTQTVLAQKPASWAWWLVPAGLLGAWFFIQTVYAMTNVVTVANLTGLLGSAGKWLGSGQESIWLSTAANLFGGQLLAQPSLSVMNNISVFGANLLSGFMWQAVIVLLYWAWLFLWWLRHNPRLGKMQNAS